MHPKRIMPGYPLPAGSVATLVYRTEGGRVRIAEGSGPPPPGAWIMLREGEGPVQVMDELAVALEDSGAAVPRAGAAVRAEHLNGAAESAARTLGWDPDDEDV